MLKSPEKIFFHVRFDNAFAGLKNKIKRRKKTIILFLTLGNGKYRLVSHQYSSRINWEGLVGEHSLSG